MIRLILKGDLFFLFQSKVVSMATNAIFLNDLYDYTTQEETTQDLIVNFGEMSTQVIQLRNQSKRTVRIVYFFYN